MKDLTFDLFVGIGIASFVGGIIGYVILAPKPRNPRSQWLKRSLISSYTGMLGLFILILTIDLNDLLNELQALDFGATWKSVWSILAYILPGGIFLTIGTYLKVLMMSAGHEFTKQWLANRNSKKK